MIIGNINTLAFDVLKTSNPEYAEMEIYINGYNISSDDCSIYVPQVQSDLNHYVENLREMDYSAYERYYTPNNESDVMDFLLSTRDIGSENFDIEEDIYSEHQFLNLGPTTDHLSIFIIKYNEKTYLNVVRFDKNDSEDSIKSKQCIEINLDEIEKTLHCLIEYLAS